MKRYSFKKCIFVFLGSIFLTLGLIGVFLPVIPTTPFLLLTSFFYMRSSEKMYNWLMNHKILGSYLYSYLTYKAIPKKTKIGALIFLWSTLTISMILMDSWHLRIFLVIVGIAVTIHLMLLRTMSLEEMKTYHETDVIAD